MKVGGGRGSYGGASCIYSIPSLWEKGRVWRQQAQNGGTAWGAKKGRADATLNADAPVGSRSAVLGAYAKIFAFGHPATAEIDPGRSSHV